MRLSLPNVSGVKDLNTVALGQLYRPSPSCFSIVAEAPTLALVEYYPVPSSENVQLVGTQRVSCDLCRRSYSVGTVAEESEYPHMTETVRFLSVAQ